MINHKFITKATALFQKSPNKKKMMAFCITKYTFWIKKYI